MNDRILTFIEKNRLNWADRVAIHLENRTGFYAIDEVLNGGDALGPIEGREVGDVSGKSVIHLQCHFGLDTLSLARRGATVTGVDFSEPAIAAARELAQKAGLRARFVNCEVTRAAETVCETFDLVFTTWGTIGWLPDLEPWAQTAATLLRPGGQLYIADGHPFMWQFDEYDPLPKKLRYHRKTPRDQPICDSDEQTYTGDPTPLAHPESYGWIHPLQDILNQLLQNNLQLDFFHEHEQLPWPQFEGMIPCEDEPRMYRLPDHGIRIPLAFSLGATKR